MAKFTDDLAELKSILLDPQTPVHVVQAAASFFKGDPELIVGHLEPMGTTGADEFSLNLDSSDLFLRYLSAMRARDWKKAVILVHGESPALVAQAG